MFDNQWFSRNGKRTLKLPSVIRKESMSEVVSTGEVHVIVALLNHAGDWSALINRSDTDRLVAAVVKLAREFPHKRFIIRLHPTMIHKHHEGVHSIQRIRSYVQWVRLANLSVSEVELQEDFERGDVFISEYSQTVIDAATMGKRIVIANFTGRRSFMSCYEEIGFPQVSDQGELRAWFEEVFKSTVQGDQQQNQAVLLYNRMLDVYLASE
jgi:CDP-glycerol glycerophosphotransferase (TagB/SpsB family)